MAFKSAFKYLIRIIAVGLFIYSTVNLIRYFRFYEKLSEYGKGEAYGYLILIIISILLFWLPNRINHSK